MSAFDELLAVMWRRTEHEALMHLAMYFHESFWGVPYGPTLTMVHPVEMKGLAGLVGPISNATYTWKQGVSPWRDPLHDRVH